MLFNSFIFIFVFLPITLIGYHQLLKTQNDKSRYGFLIIASVFFYGYWDIRFVPLLLISITVNYYIAKTLISNPNKTLLTTGVCFNLLLIGYFKYADFFSTTTAPILSNSTIEIILPLGISFFTFQQIAYLIDAHQGIVKTHDPYEYFLFVTFFPQLIAGPIVHHHQLIPQFRRQDKFSQLWNSPLFTQGLILLIIGLFKKVVMADNLSTYVDPVFNDVTNVTFLEAWTAAIAYTLQLYFDFCGYSEMAMGIALMFGILLPLNFNSPYKAISIIDFWHRWHITLGIFFKEYVYIPLGGNQQGLMRLLFTLMLTMFLVGLWHGAGWTFIIWGLLHGCYLSVNHLWRSTRWSLPKKLSWWITFMSVVIAWVIFRAHNLSDAGILLTKMLGADGVQLPPLFQILTGSFINEVNIAHSSLINGFEIMLMVLIMLFLTRTPNIHQYLECFRPTQINKILFSMLAGIAVFSLNSPTAFLYHQF
ncbi:Probable poly(beta-D-mannuronate) O-acetylase [hydrothermal vent metagenome]|uniref:Probable poly(Beta-D-mannuronate) O-acetylase n=1 Tax=hydrothermal vent metagenome TaxID=652676 RepID=A0A3B0YZI1_9ZZZZ